MKRYWKEEKGSVMLEFCLVLPIYLLLFGGTFLMFDITMGRLHLQEANRNLAWIQNDRYDSAGKINQKLYQSSVNYFEIRNAQESTMDDNAMWSFGEAYKDYQEKQNSRESKTKSEADFWGHAITEFKDSDAELKLNNGWASTIGLDKVFDNDYITMYSGNMELKMDKVSAVYIGAVGLSSVLFPNGEKNHLYQQAYVFTRALEKSDANKVNSEMKVSNINTEMILLRRKGTDCRENINTLNILKPNSNLFFENIIFRSWVSNGTLGDIQLFLGVKL